MCGVLITPTDSRCSLDVHTCVLSIHHRSLEHAPCSCDTHPTCRNEDPRRQCREGKGAGRVRYRHLAAPPAAAAGSPRDRVQQVPATARPRMGAGEWAGDQATHSEQEGAREEAELGEQRVHDRQSG